MREAEVVRFTFSCLLELDLLRKAGVIITGTTVPISAKRNAAQRARNCRMILQLELKFRWVTADSIS
jgi:hypothetical protein